MLEYFNLKEKICFEGFATKQITGLNEIDDLVS